MSGPPKSNTVPPATAARSNCASSDGCGTTLDIRRQTRRQTVHLATATRSYCASGDSQSPKSASSCRRRHSLPGQLSLGAQFVWLVLAGGTVCLSRCRRRHSLTVVGHPRTRPRGCRRLPWPYRTQTAPLTTPARNQTVQPATAARSYCASGDSSAFILCIWRQQRVHTVHLATATRSYCASGDSQSPKSASSCRRRHSLPSQMSSETQFAWPDVAGDTVFMAALRRRHILAANGGVGGIVHASSPYEKERPGAIALRPPGPSVRAACYSATGPAARTSSDISGYFAAALSTNIFATRCAVSS